MTRDGADAKVWLYPEAAFAYNHGFDARTQRWILSVVRARQSEIEEVWNDDFA